jgi:hypothetical protein
MDGSTCHAGTTTRNRSSLPHSNLVSDLMSIFITLFFVVLSPSLPPLVVLPLAVSFFSQSFSCVLSLSFFVFILLYSSLPLLLSSSPDTHISPSHSLPTLLIATQVEWLCKYPTRKKPRPRIYSRPSGRVRSLGEVKPTSLRIPNTVFANSLILFCSCVTFLSTFISLSRLLHSFLSLNLLPLFSSSRLSFSLSVLPYFSSLSVSLYTLL